MTRRIVKIALSIVIAIVFIWLALRSVNPRELWDQIQQIQLHWIPPFTLALLISHYLRAERWRLLLRDVELMPGRSTLFAGVMTGYMFNYVFPRLGEISRPVYVARKMKISSGNLLGTIVLERIIDLFCLIVFLVYISLTLVREREVMREIFGTEAWATKIYIFLPLAILIFVLLAWSGYRLLLRFEESRQTTYPVLSKFVAGVKKFWEGLISIRNVKNWPLFVIYTLGIWGGYAVMAYLPLWMLDLHILYDLGIVEAIVVTVVSAVGISIPTPGGLGTYHLFVQQSLWLLYSVPLVSALTYATITHAASIFMVFLVGAGALWFDKYYTLRYGESRKAKGKSDPPDG